ncbi:DNA processing protein [Allopseudospirillum japonicum]|uniref:DNA processing protein n=1 Tax=Allopseudospirillum japonicum TaxID=64971 RepID=A0A1H6TUD7_9GAMM|nr:DNA-processing protein DprA [Allopseudospirillum japonicum]SEI79352.1 DNA processing protein [Allopseudospirillum japonicum]
MCTQASWQTQFELSTETQLTRAAYEEREWISSLCLLATPKLGSRTLIRALHQFGNAYLALQAIAAQTQNFTYQGRISPQDQQALQAAAKDWRTSPYAPQIEHHLQWLAQASREIPRSILTPQSQDYPSLLLEISDPPPVLFVQGQVSYLHLPQLAMVGSRNPTAEGERNAFAFARYMAEGGFTITSGLALGIDAAAHQGALQASGYTLAVLACGLDKIYPSVHQKLAQQIARQGALISEWPLKTPPLAKHFPRRNRIISGLSLGTLVVEAAPRSGSLISARMALEQNREVFAIPGSIHNVHSRGCHQLIRDGATLVETAADIIQALQSSLQREWLLNPQATLASTARPLHNSPLDQTTASLGTSVTAQKSAKLEAPPESHARQKDPPSEELSALLGYLGSAPQPLDLLVERTQWPVTQLQEHLLLLELEGWVQHVPGGYIRCR